MGGTNQKVGKIGDSAIKVACLRVNPGTELEVINALKSACDKRDDIEHHVFMKGFGFYDIILIYDAPHFDFQLSEAGHIPGITSSNSFLCFPYFGSSSKRIFHGLNNSTFAGLCFIKFNNNSKTCISEIEQNFLTFLGDTGINDPYILGTIGWNEVILFFCDNKVQKITEKLFKLNYNNDIDDIIEKTFSSIAINHLKLPREEDFSGGLKKIQKFFKTYPDLAEPVSLKTTPTVTVKISSRPLYYDEIKTFWLSNNFTTGELLGDYDIFARPKKGVSWGNFLSFLLYFRWCFRNKINSTCTSIEMETELKNNTDEVNSAIPCFGDFGYNGPQGLCNPTDFDIKKLMKIFGPAAPLLSNHFYSLNSLLQDPLQCKAFESMAEYPHVVLRIGEKVREAAKSASYDHKENQWTGGKKLYSKSETIESIGMMSAIAIANGSQVRSYGIYGHIAGHQGGFSRLRGGVQRSLQAIEFMPAYIFDRIDLTWHGFIIVEDPKFSHINEVISVPPTALWRPDLWWAIYHEVGHVLLTRVNWIEEDVPVIKRLLWNKRMPKLWFDFLVELAAEIVGYECGFFSDFDLFFEVLVEHLTDIEPILKKYVSMDIYLLRTLFVEVFESRFREEIITPKEFKDERFLYNHALQHIEKAGKIIDDYKNEKQRKSGNHALLPDTTDPWRTEDKCFLAAGFAATLKELSDFASYLKDCINEFEETKKPLKTKDDRYSKNTDDAFSIIKDGQVCWNDIQCPEALLYRITQDRKKLNFQSSIATILTFWNLSL